MKYISLVGAMIMLASCIFNAKEILRGKAKPNLVSYIMWTLAPIIGSIVAISEGITWSYVPIFASNIGMIILFICAILKKNAFIKIQMYDILCGIVSISALAMWYITKNPITALGLSIISDFMSCLPTIVKSWKQPETEPPVAWIGYSISAWTGVLAIEMWNFSEVSYPLYLALVNTFMLMIIIRKKNK